MKKHLVLVGWILMGVTAVIAGGCVSHHPPVAHHSTYAPVYGPEAYAPENVTVHQTRQGQPVIYAEPVHHEPVHHEVEEHH